jgi:hypothetical protein
MGERIKKNKPAENKKTGEDRILVLFLWEWTLPETKIECRWFI